MSKQKTNKTSCGIQSHNESFCLQQTNLMESKKKSVGPREDRMNGSFYREKQTYNIYKPKASSKQPPQVKIPNRNSKASSQNPDSNFNISPSKEKNNPLQTTTPSISTAAPTKPSNTRLLSVMEIQQGHSDSQTSIKQDSLSLDDPTEQPSDQTDIYLQLKHQGLRNTQNLTPNESKTDYALKQGTKR